MKHLIISLATAFASFAGLIQGEERHVIEARRYLQEEATVFQSLGFKIFSWGGSFINQINALMLSVELPVTVDFSNSRTVFTICLFDLISSVNENKQAYPYYKNYPMTVENIEFRMITKDFDTLSSHKDPVVSLIFNVGDKIIYCHRDETTKSLVPFFRESFEKNAHPDIVKSLPHLWDLQQNQLIKQ